LSVIYKKIRKDFPRNLMVAPCWKHAGKWGKLGQVLHMERMMSSGKLTTHVLDTALGKPAAGVKITLYRVLDGHHEKLAETVTNADGRTDAPMLVGAALTVGSYELVFCAGAYLRASGQAKDEVLFLDEIPIRFGVPDAGAHYHVPLLISPFAYSTYRGS
jgi:5-hydroxyisourate hydrolase